MGNKKPCRTLKFDHWKFYSAVYLASEFLPGIIQAYLGNHKAEQLLKKTHTHTQSEGKRLFLKSWMVWWISYYSGAAYSSLWFCLPREDLVTFQMLWVAKPSIPHQWLHVARALGNCCSATSRAVIDRQPSCIAICQFLSVPASIVSNERWLAAVQQ